MNTLIITYGNMTDQLAQLCKHYKNVLKTDPELLSDLSDLGWDYTCGRMSRSGMEVYDKIMIKLGVLEPLEHWNEECYQDHGCTHQYANFISVTPTIDSTVYGAIMVLYQTNYYAKT